MKCSICIATYSKPEPLRNTLESIFCQDVKFPFEVIVVDDGSPETETHKVCMSFPNVQYHRINRKSNYRNPSIARNVAYRQATGEVLICQSDDVIHHTKDAITQLVNKIGVGTFLLATVINIDSEGKIYANKQGKGYGDKLEIYVSPKRQRPLFFLGSLFRKDLYAVGGNDEEFVAPSAEDRWFALCLMNGLKLKPIYLSSVLGHHQAHNHCDPFITKPSQRLIARKTNDAHQHKIPWCSAGGPWLTE